MDTLLTVYRYKTPQTPTVTVYRTRESIDTMGASVLEETARNVPASEVTASGLWEPAKVLVVA